MFFEGITPTREGVFVDLLKDLERRFFKTFFKDTFICREVTNITYGRNNVKIFLL